MSNFLYRQIANTFENYAHAPCFRTPSGTTWTYADLQERTARCAGVLTDAGVSTGDRLLAQSGKCPDAVALYLACLQKGVVYVPMNTAYTQRELCHYIEDARPAALVMPAESPDLRDRVLRAWVLDETGCGSLAQAIDEADPDSHVCEPAGAEIAAILYTSGTTGPAKGAMLTQENLLSNALALIDCWNWQQEDVLLHALPICHIHGLFVGLHCALLTGSQLVLLPRFEVSAVLEALPHCTAMMGVPTYYSRLLERTDFHRERVRDVRLFISGSAPLPERVFTAFECRTGKRILERYGLTETLINTSSPLTGERNSGSVGFPISGVEVRIVGDKGVELRREEVGGIEVRGPSVFRGYWRRSDITSDCFTEEQWFKTGDLGAMDPEGQLHILGRVSDLIISGGLNVYPIEVENAMEAMEGMIESAVFGVPHPDLGEAVVAAVRSETDADLSSVRCFLNKRIAAFKHPKMLFRVDSIPRNTLGKVRRAKLRSRYRSVFEIPDS